MLLPAQIAIAAANYRSDIHLFSDRKEGRNEDTVEGGKSRQAKLKLTSSVVSDPVAERVQKGPEQCPGLIVLSKDR